MICKNCGQVLSDDCRFCTACGAPQRVGPDGVMTTNIPAPEEEPLRPVLTFDPPAPEEPEPPVDEDPRAVEERLARQLNELDNTVPDARVILDGRAPHDVHDYSDPLGLEDEEPLRPELTLDAPFRPAPEEPVQPAEPERPAEPEEPASAEEPARQAPRYEQPRPRPAEAEGPFYARSGEARRPAQNEEGPAYSRPHPEYNARAAAQAEEPVTLGEWIITMVLSALPIVNIVMLCIWAFGSNTKPSKRTWARAALIMLAVSVVLSIVMGAIGVASAVGYLLS